MCKDQKKKIKKQEKLIKALSKSLRNILEVMGEYPSVDEVKVGK